jgi:hypothetical protein
LHAHRIRDTRRSCCRSGRSRSGTCRARGAAVGVPEQGGWRGHENERNPKRNGDPKCWLGTQCPNFLESRDKCRLPKRPLVSRVHRNLPISFGKPVCPQNSKRARAKRNRTVLAVIRNIPLQRQGTQDQQVYACRHPDPFEHAAHPPSANRQRGTMFSSIHTCSVSDGRGASAGIWLVAGGAARSSRQAPHPAFRGSIAPARASYGPPLGPCRSRRRPESLGGPAHAVGRSRLCR